MAYKGRGPIVSKAVYTDSARDQDILAMDIAAHAAEGHVVTEYSRVVKAEGMKFNVTVLIVRRRLDHKGDLV